MGSENLGEEKGREEEERDEETCAEALSRLKAQGSRLNSRGPVRLQPGTQALSPAPCLPATSTRNLLWVNTTPTPPVP